MKNLKLLLFTSLLIIISSVSFISCDKTSETESDNYVSNYVKTTIYGIVYDNNHDLLPNAQVTAYGATRITDENGIFVFKNIYVPKGRCFVNVEHNGFFSIMRSKIPNENSVTRLDAQLIQLQVAPQSFPSGTAYTAVLNDGISTIDFPATSNFVDQNGNMYSGNVFIQAITLDPTNENYSRQAPCGDQVGKENNELRYLDAHTGVMVELVDDSGRPLQLASGSTANISLQIPAGLQGGAPATIPVFYASAANGYNNSEDPGAVKDGSEYKHTVGHFSYWSTQISSPDFGILNCRLIDANGATLSGVRVQVGRAYGITNNNGTFKLRVPTNRNLDVAVRSLDFYGMSIVSPQAAWSNGEQRFVELQLPNLDHLIGTLVDCNNQAIQGLVTLRWNNNISSTISEDGTFDLPCLSGASTYRLFIKTDTKDTIINVDIAAGINNMGHVSLCDGVLPNIHNHVEVNQGDTLLIDYTNFYTTYDGHSYVDTTTGNVQSSYAGVSGVDGQFDVYFDGPNTTGLFTIGSGASCYFTANNPYQSYQVENGTVKITQYGPVGGFIKGTVDGTTMYNDHVHIDFEVYRSADITYAP